MKPHAADLRRYRRHLAKELDNVALYRELAQGAGAEHREVLLELAKAEERHAQFWEDKLNELGAVVPPPERHRPAIRSRALSWLGRRWGVRRVVPLIERMEASERTRYDADTDATSAMAAEERVHAELVASLDPAWRSRVSSSIRAAVFGINDGLVSNLALVMGMAGGGVTSNVVLLAGIAGLVAGAGSMAAGEYISVTSQRELVQAGTRLGAAEMAAMAEREPAAFERLARTLSLHLPARDPHDDDRHLAAVGSPLRAAAFSFVAFAAGAALPVLPFALGSGSAALVTAAVLAATALVVVGALISLVTHRSAFRTGLRQLVVGALAAAGTFLVGRLVDASLL